MQPQIQEKHSSGLLTSSLPSGRAGFLQRKCACGGTPGLDGECAECRQRRLLGRGGLSIQPKLAVDQPGDRFEEEADRAAEQVTLAAEPPTLSHTRPMVQRAPEEEIPASSPETVPAAEPAATPAAQPTT